MLFALASISPVSGGEELFCGSATARIIKSALLLFESSLFPLPLSMPPTMALGVESE